MSLVAQVEDAMDKSSMLESDIANLVVDLDGEVWTRADPAALYNTKRILGGYV